MILLLGYGGALLCIFITVLRGPAANMGLYKIGLDVTTLEIGTVLLVIALQQNFERQSREAATLSASAKGKAAQALFHSTAFVRWFGRNSYEVYLTHMLAVCPMVILFSHFKQNINTAPLWFLATTALAGALGYLVARFYSEPANHRLRQRFSTKRAKSLSATAAN
jgi:peptidoglycan/LPS O-acetylase OafA/YrhL